LEALKFYVYETICDHRKVTFIDRGRSTVEFEYITYMKYRKNVIIIIWNSKRSDFL